MFEFGLEFNFVLSAMPVNVGIGDSRESDLYPTPTRRYYSGRIEGHASPAFPLTNHAGISWHWHICIGDSH